MKRSLREYTRELIRGFWSGVVAVVLEALGLLAIFWSNTHAFHVVGAVGVALGAIVAPFLAFHRMRMQRDAALSGSTLVTTGLRLANDLSYGNWGLDSLWGMSKEGIGARAMVGERQPVAPNTQLNSFLANTVKSASSGSSLEDFLRNHFGAGGQWELVSRTNDWVITAMRTPQRLDDEWELTARVIAQLPTSFRGNWAVILADVYIQPTGKREPDAMYNAALAPKPRGSARLDLCDVRDLLAALGTTVVDELAPIVFPHLIASTRYQRLRARLRKHRGLKLIGPNFDFQSKPHILIDALEMPQLRRREGAPNDNRLYAETPAKTDPFESAKRQLIICDGIIRSLRQHEYEDVEEFARELSTSADAKPPVLVAQHAA